MNKSNQQTELIVYFIEFQCKDYILKMYVTL